MNDLSWLLYIADISSSVSKLLVLLTISCCIIIVGYFISHCMSMDAISNFGRYAAVDDEDIKKVKEEIDCIKSGPLRVRYLVMAIVFMLVAVAIPSKNTFYLIAGSEAGEHVVMSEEGQEILTDIKTIIKQQIKEIKD